MSNVIGMRTALPDLERAIEIIEHRLHVAQQSIQLPFKGKRTLMTSIHCRKWKRNGRDTTACHVQQWNSCNRFTALIATNELANRL